MALHLLFFYVFNYLNLLCEIIANPITPKPYIGGIGRIGTVSLDDRELVGRSVKQDVIFSDIIKRGDLSVFENNPEILSIESGASGGDTALFDSEVFSLDQDNPQPDSNNDNIGTLASEDPGNLEQIFPFSGGGSEVATSCQQEDDLDYFLNDFSMLTSRNLIDEYYDLRIPEGILAPNQLCPGPLNKIPTTRQPTGNKKLPFPFPLPDYASTRCRVGLGEVPLYALCCYMADSEYDGSEGNACYPGEIQIFFSA